MQQQKALGPDADLKQMEVTEFRAEENDGTLVVDLEGTLIRTNLLHETFWSAVSRDPAAALSALPAMLRGRAVFREALVRRVPLDPVGLPYDEECLALLEHWRARGGRTALVNRSGDGLALTIADHLGLFDEVRPPGTRMPGGGPGPAVHFEGFDDRGRHDASKIAADLAAWRNARRAISGNLPAGHRNTGAERPGVGPKLTGTGRFWPAAHLRVMRPHQWVKNILVFVPAFAAHDFSAQTLLFSSLAFVAFSLVASGTYILNDLLDLAADRAHPRKRSRPLASGAVPLLHGSLMAPALVAFGMIAAFATGNLTVVGILAVYIGLTIAYSIALKRHLIIDVSTLAGLYTVRIIAGGLATGVQISQWMFAFSIFIFLCLAAVKRQAELRSGLTEGRATASGRAYESGDLPIMAMMSIGAGYVAVLIVALYIEGAAVRPLYNTPEFLWGICPVLLYWISRMVMITHRGKMHDDPIVFAARDRVSLICAALVGALVIGASL